METRKRNKKFFIHLYLKQKLLNFLCWQVLAWVVDVDTSLVLEVCVPAGRVLLTGQSPASGVGQTVSRALSTGPHPSHFSISMSQERLHYIPLHHFSEGSQVLTIVWTQVWDPTAFYLDYNYFLRGEYNVLYFKFSS